MSTSSDGKYIICDASECIAQTNSPVTLQSASVDATPVPARWLHVQCNGVWQHYCPSHSKSKLLASSASLPYFGSLRSRQILLVVDKSEVSRESAESVADCLAGSYNVDVTLLFSACARCMPRSEPERIEATPPLEAYCPGTRNAIAKLTELFQSRAIPVKLQVRTSTILAELIALETACTDYDVIIVSASLQEPLSVPLHTPLFVLAKRKLS